MAYYGGWRPYVSVGRKRALGLLAMEKRRKKGHDVSPVRIEGRQIATTFWGKAWCDNLESYSDYENRLPRGRTYVRNGSVVDLQIKPGEVTAFVSGSAVYAVELKIAPVAASRWKAICADCAGEIGSLVELLQGSFSKGVMERICRQKLGLFPSPSEIKLSCSCPDWAEMCKHVAAVMYGVGARLDHRPELLFQLRQVDEKDLIAKAGAAIPLAKKGSASRKVLASSNIADIFGLDMADNAQPAAKRQSRNKPLPAPRGKKTVKVRASPASAKTQPSSPKARAQSPGKDTRRARAPRGES